VQVPLILFSGGLDSTYLLNFRLKHAPADTLYVSGGQHPLKIEAETKASAKILKLIEADQPYKVRNRLTLDSLSFAGAPATGFTQAPAWLFAALYHADPEVHNAVDIAYVMGDEITGCIHQLERAWEALWSVGKQGPLVPLQFPLKMHRKAQFLQELPQKILDEVWVCEVPTKPGKTIKACGQCAACVRSFHEWSRFNNRATMRAVPSGYRKLDKDPQVIER
jgi:7-cyano-7-deazaguanine synthase in queuosine biosynthesis